MRLPTWSSLVLLGSLSTPAETAGQDAPTPVTFSGSVAVVSDYAFRGVSQTLEDIAVQGGITGASTAGLYLGLWGSSLNFGEATAADRAHTEIDAFGGLKRNVAGVDADLGFVYYAYPGTTDSYDYNFLELALGLSRAFSGVSTGAKVAFSPDYFAASGSATYLSGSLGFAVPSAPVSLLGTLGHQSIEENAAFGTPDYTDWSAGASLSAAGVSIGITYVDTDLAKTDCFAGADLCAPRVVFSVARGM